jgi:hypothetical protein
MRGSPLLPGIEQWREIYMATCRQNKAHPDAGLFLKEWMVQAGFNAESVDYTNSVITYSHSDEPFRIAWGEAWAERTIESAFATQAIASGIATPVELEASAAAWREWAANSDATFFYVNGEVIGHKI